MSSNIYNIYLIRNRINGYTYVGRTISPIEKRFRKHCTQAFTHPKGLLQAAIVEYGEENFGVEALYTGSDPLMEDTFINKYKPQYNTQMKSGGIPTEEYRNNCSKRVFTQETKDKIRKTLKEKWKNGEMKNSLTEEGRKRISEAAKKRNRGPITEETRRRMSEAQTGERNSQYGKKRSPEHIAKIVASQKVTRERMRLEKMREVS